MLRLMSDDIELLRRLTEAFNRGDLATMRESYAPDIIVDAGELWPAASGPVRGVEHVLAGFASIAANFERVEVIAQDYIEHPGAVVVPSRWCGTVSGSDSVIEQPIVVVYRLRDNLVTSIQYFGNLIAATTAAEGEPPTAVHREQ